MLSRLSISDIVLIDRIDLDFSTGLTIFTGETGAGKSIILDALSLTLGARGDGSLVRSGSESGQVTAVFGAYGKPLRARLEALAIPPGEELVVRRQQYADGRTRAFVNDQPVTLQTLRALTHELVEIHGQHDERALLDVAEHRALVDAYGEATEAAKATRDAYERLADVRNALERERASVDRRRADADYARHALEEIRKAAPLDGEERLLADRRQAMQQGEKVAQDLNEANEALNGEASVLASVAAVARRLERRLSQAPTLIEPCVKALSDSMDALGVAAQRLEDALRASAFDPRELERCEERLFALRALARKYSVEVDGLSEAANRFESQVLELQRGESNVESMTKDLDEAREHYDAAATRLTGIRIDAARRLERAVTAELPSLKLDQGAFYVEVETEAERTAPEGRERIAFEVRTNPGTNRGELAKIASGGELARFLLALKVALTERTGAPTIVFDEIDTGVGGAVADAIGQRLSRLARGAQVLAVTHAPQVAARADRHLKIVKAVRDDRSRSVTDVAPLDRAARTEEIARMLSGSEITKAARAAARSLIER
jgi:DNA repair protein RecN (Recombination protein N)